MRYLGLQAPPGEHICCMVAQPITSAHELVDLVTVFELHSLQEKTVVAHNTTPYANNKGATPTTAFNANSVFHKHVIPPP
jgi:hypothetical protein